MCSIERGFHIGRADSTSDGVRCFITGKRRPLGNDRLVFRSFYPRPRRQHRTTHADLGCSAMLAACAAQPQLSVLWGREHNDKPWWRGLNTHVTS